MPFPEFDPVLIHLGPLPIRWYALAYVAGIVLGWWYATRLVKTDRLWGGRPPMTPAQLDDLVLWIVLGIILAVQQLEGNVLQPWLQSKSMDLHAVIVLLSVTLGGTLFGITGAFLAVPAVASLAVVLRYLNEQIAERAGESLPPANTPVTTQVGVPNDDPPKDPPNPVKGLLDRD